MDDELPFDEPPPEKPEDLPPGWPKMSYGRTFTSSMLEPDWPRVSSTSRPGKNGAMEILFEETGPMERERDRTSVLLKLRKDANLSKLSSWETLPLPGMERYEQDSFMGQLQSGVFKSSHQHGYPSVLAGINGFLSEESWDDTRKKIYLVLAPHIQMLLDAILQDASATLTIRTQRDKYLREAWTRAIKTVKRALTGVVTGRRLIEQKEAAYEEHRKAMGEFLEDRRRTANAVIPRALANPSLIFAGSNRPEPIRQDGNIIDPKAEKDVIVSRLNKILANAQTDGTSTRAFAAAALQQLDGDEILGLMGLLKYLRGRAEVSSKGIQSPLPALIIEPEAFLAEVGLFNSEKDRKDKQRAKERMEAVFMALAKKTILIGARKEDSKHMSIAKGTSSGYFHFESLSMSSPEGDAGSWKFTSLALLQVLSEEDSPFRPVPLDPFAYVAQQTTPKERNPIMRFVLNVQLEATVAQTPREYLFSKYGLGSGAGSRRENAERKQEIAIHALSTYGQGTIEPIPGGIRMTPNTQDKEQKA